MKSTELVILHISASPRGEHSQSRRAASAFLDALRLRRPGIRVLSRDVWNHLPSFDGHALDAKYAKLVGRALSPDQADAWDEIAQLISEIEQCDALVISSPMWNFGIPYRLKHWIDLVTQPGLTFSFKPEVGYAPLLHSRPTLCILASAGDYSSGPSFGRPDLASPYLEATLGFIGMKSIDICRLGPTVGADGAVSAGFDKAQASLTELAQTFLEQPS